MNKKQNPYFRLAVWLLFTCTLAIWSSHAGATDRYVADSDEGCAILGEEFGATSCDYSTVDSAVTAALTACTSGDVSDNIRIAPSSNAYAGISAIDTSSCSGSFSVTFEGVEAARTILSGTTLISAQTSSNLTINVRYLTFESATTGISVPAGATTTIKNSIFQNISGTAVNISQPTTLIIENNTFYNNGTGIARDDTSGTIMNNIFSNNDVAISASDTSGLYYNLYFSNGDDSTGVRETSAVTGDPLFVDAANGDFHLTEGSPAIEAGDSSVGKNNVGHTDTGYLPDIGAYGAASDTIPFIVSNVTATTGDSGIDVTWDPNNSYAVTNTDTTLQGGYNIYFSDSSGTISKVGTVSSTETSATITGVTTTTSAPDAPTLDEPGYGNETLYLSWSEVSDATTYYIYYTDLSTGETKTVDVGDAVTTYTLTGLVNGQTYSVAVSAVNDGGSTFYVTAFDNRAATDGSSPGTLHESEYSEGVTLDSGTAAESELSNTVEEYPEASNAYPGLPNKGCFIATAAFGYYSAPQVQALRDFRDRYLVTNGPGKAFVDWYYRYGPIGADFINRHEWLKPVVRVGLMPAVGAALFMTKTKLLTKIIIMLLAGIFSIY